MSPAAFALVAAAALVHATWNLVAKRAAAAGGTFVLAYNLFAVLAYAPWALGLLVQPAPPWSVTAAGCVGLSGLIHLAYGLALQRGYRVADFSVVYPVARGSGPLLAALGAVLLLGERPSGTGLLGLAAVVAGIGLIATQGDLSALSRPDGRAGLRWGTATGGLIAAYTVVDAYAVGRLGVSPVVVNWGSNLVQLLLLAPILGRTQGGRAAMAGHWRSAVAVGLLSPLAYILVLAALETGAPVGVVAPAREMSMMVGALLGLVVLREPVGPWRLLGCLVLGLGVLLLGHA